MTTDEQWATFFAAFAETGVLKSACKAAGIGRSTVYDRITVAEKPDASDESKAWLARYKEAELDARDVLVEEIYRRGVVGVDEPLIGRVGPNQDGVVATVKRYSDALLIRLAQARMPEQFKDRVAKEVSGPGGGPVQTETRVIAVPAILDNAPE